MLRKIDGMHHSTRRVLVNTPAAWEPHRSRIPVPEYSERIPRMMRLPRTNVRGHHILRKPAVIRHRTCEIAELDRQLM
jgi:hypothetical protein